jgi:FkbM family methyltransferase
MFDIENFINYKNNENYQSPSQLGQDYLVQWILKNKFGGYFVDFGATDGYGYSNTVMLERLFGWNGIVCEPNLSYIPLLMMNRNCHIDTNCVYEKTGDTVRFCQTENGDLSTIKKYLDNDHMSVHRTNYVEYDVKTISLKDLLDKYDAPSIIDYLSIDTEGSEYPILSNYDFSRMFRVISVEHNWNSNRENIYNLLTSMGYERIFTEISEFDDWYIHPELIKET